jgi:hypothetical protein
LHGTLPLTVGISSVYGYSQETKTLAEQTVGSRHIFVLLCYGSCRTRICFGLSVSWLGISLLETEQDEVAQRAGVLYDGEIGRGGK